MHLNLIAYLQFTQIVVVGNVARQRGNVMAALRRLEGAIRERKLVQKVP